MPSSKVESARGPRRQSCRLSLKNKRKNKTKQNSAKNSIRKKEWLYDTKINDLLFCIVRSAISVSPQLLCSSSPRKIYISRFLCICCLLLSSNFFRPSLYTLCPVFCLDGYTYQFLILRRPVDFAAVSIDLSTSVLVMRKTREFGQFSKQRYFNCVYPLENVILEMAARDVQSALCLKVYTCQNFRVDVDEGYC